MKYQRGCKHDYEILFNPSPGQDNIDSRSFKTLFHLQRLLSVELYERMITVGEVERIGKEAVVACFKVLSLHSLGGKPLSYDSLCPGRDSSTSSKCYRSSQLARFQHEMLLEMF